MNSGYCFVLQDDSITLISLALCTIISVFVFGLLKKQFFDIKFWIHPFTLLSIAIFFVMLINFDFNIWGSYFRQISIILIAVFFSKCIDFSKFKITFLNFMLVVSIVSLIAWIIFNVFNWNLPLPIINSTWEKAYYTEYSNGLLFFIYKHQPERLMGPFWEPGLYASMSIIALLLNGKKVKIFTSFKQRLIDIILSVCILLTMSTAGYILLLIVFCIRILQNVKKKSVLFIVLFTLLIISLILLTIFIDDIILYLSQLSPKIFGKLTFESLSKTTRLNGPIVDMSIFFQSPICGVGMKTYLQEWPTFAHLYNGESRTSTITYFLANYGMLGILYVFTLLRGVFKQKGIDITVKTLILIVFISILSKEPHYFNLLSCTVIAYIYHDDNMFFIKEPENSLV